MIIARKVIPTTSSMTEAERMVTPSGLAIFFRSLKIRPVISTEVAIATTPRKRTRGSDSGTPSMRAPTDNPAATDTAAPLSPTTLPARANRKKRRRSVWRPIRKRSTTEATTAKP